MGSLRKHTLGAVLSAATIPFAAGADDLGPAPPDQLHFFATCAGRLSAQMEHQWMFDGPASEATAVQNQAVVELLDAITEPDMQSAAMGWRIEAKVAHRALLANAALTTDPRRAAKADAQAQRLIAPCTAMLLG
jgi:hypothetical protein